jgi:cytochrome c peroxidase
MKKSILLFGGIALAVIGFQNCKQTDDLTYATEKQLVLPATIADYKAEVNSFIKDMPLISLNPQKVNVTNAPNIDMTFNNGAVGNIHINFGASEIKNEVATLGRVLFYDTKMSINNVIACGSCHLQSKAFADVSAGSQGFKGDE